MPQKKLVRRRCRSAFFAARWASSELGSDGGLSVAVVALVAFFFILEVPPTALSSFAVAPTEVAPAAVAPAE